MLHSKFQEVLEDFNRVEGTDAKCQCIFMRNFVVSGLTTAQIDRLNESYMYHPDRYLGTGVMRGEDYDRMGVVLKPRSEPSYTNMLLGNTVDDMLGTMIGRVTNGKLYEIVEDLGWIYKIVDDSGIHGDYHYSWFTPVKLYDEDETKLTCRDIEFEEGDCIDLRKHTPDQIRQIAEHYWVYELEGVLSESEDWRYLVCDGEKFDTWSGIGDYTSDGEEYTYDDIFYLEE